MSRKRAALLAAGSLAGAALLLVVGGILVIRSGWFYEQVRERIVETIENATGGRAELGAYRFDWKHLRVEIDGFVLHGAEPAGKPPLLRAASIAAGLKIISLFRRDVDIQYFDVQAPRIYLMIDAEGHTNVPEPKLKRHNAQNPVEDLLNLAVGRFSVRDGIFEVEGRGKTPFDATGRNLGAKFSYDPARPRYLGDLAVQPLEVRWEGQTAVPVDVQMSVALERNRIAVTAARWATGHSTVRFSGAVDDLAHPHAAFDYQADASLSDFARIARIPGLESGAAQLSGNFRWPGAEDYEISGNLRASGVSFRQDDVRLGGLRLTGALHADPKGIVLNGVRLSGEGSYQGYTLPLEARIGAVSLRNQDLEFRQLAADLLGGSFQGGGALEGFRRFRLRGEIAGIQARNAVAVYNRRQTLPWDSLVSGSVNLEGGLRRAGDLQLSANLSLAPVPGAAPVRGHVGATYDARSGLLEVDSSTLSLPSSRIDLSGALGGQMRVRLETRDLNDFLPALGENAASLPLKLENGSLLFEGTVSGKPEDPRLAGHFDVARFSYSGEFFDSLSGDGNASAGNIAVRNASLSRGGIRAQFGAVVGLQAWKAGRDSSIAANGTVRGASLADLSRLLHKDLPATGTFNAAGQVGGTLSQPQANGTVEIVKGSIRSEPFDRVAARFDYTGSTLRASAGTITAGAKQVRFEGDFEHAPGNLESGRLRLQLQSNDLPLGQIRALAEARPGIGGTVQLVVNGTAQIAPSSVRIADLHANVTARSLELDGRALGNAHLQANSEGALLRATLDSDFANSMLRGQGEWRMEGDYPGSGTVSFPRIDLATLRDWVAPAKSGRPSEFTGSAGGQLAFQGPALQPRLWKAELRLSSVEIGPGPAAPAIPGGVPFRLRNSGPVVAAVANSVLTVESAHFVGPSSDVTLGGRILLEQKNPLDLRANGRVDLAVLHDFNQGIASSGAVVLDATLHGSLAAPQFGGRMEVEDASVNYIDFSNGISNANGTVVFTGDRANIQKLSGESGGGKIQLTGFVGYEAGAPVFRIHTDAQSVRLRYPRGISTMADASLNFTGTTARSMISGTVTVLRTGVNLESDFSSLLAKSAEPVRVPSSAAGFLGGLNFDVEIQTAPDIQFETSLTQGVQANATLRLRGTATNPALIGRIDVTQGQVVFFGTKYTINQGTISFYNAVKIDPVLDIDLQTRARGIDVTLTISGPMDKLNLTPRSDPPLQSNEIVALLATGRTPTSDPNLAAQQGSAAQPFQQSASSALLGQVITSPVSGRLQRFFGISKLRIDPTLPGIEYNPQARLTLEQQVTPDITFTYITDVTSANPQVVSVEWAVSKQWSVVAQREENGLFGLDFFYKKRFK